MSDLRQPARRAAMPGQTTRFGGEIVNLPGNRAAITGTPGQVGQMLAMLGRTGRLVSSTLPQPTGVPAQVLVNVRLVPPVQRTYARATPVRRGLARWAVWSIVGGALALAAGLAWLIYTAVTAVAEHVASIGGVLLLALVLLALVGLRVGGRTFSGTFRGRIH